jgi:hypothetical protein
VSELFLLLALIGTLAALKELRERNRPLTWAFILAGACLAILAQADFYSATGLGLAFLGILAAELISRRRTGWSPVAKGAAIALLATLVCSLPAMVQSFWVNPQSAIRLGLFPVSRLRPPFIEVGRWYGAVAALMAVGWLLHHRSGDAEPRRTRQRQGHAVMVATCVGALLAMPVTSVILAKGIELYHYRDAFTRYFSLALVVVGLQLAERLWRFGAGKLQAAKHPNDSDAPIRHRAGAEWVLIPPAILVCLIFTWRFATVVPTRSGHMRPDFDEWAALSDYRRPFVELTRELSTSKYGDRPVLGTFDHQVWSWWVTFRGGYSFLADACTSNASDAELERRSVSLARLIGMSRENFDLFMRRRYVMIFWMSCSKYQGSRAYSFAPLVDYSEDDRQRIARTAGYLNFSVALPLSQQARLGRLFESIDLARLNRLDIVVLTKDESVAGLAPPMSEFELTFENRLFRVWVRRHTQDQAD